MQVTVEDLNTVTKKVVFNFPVEMVDAEVEKSFRNIQKKAKLQGFRQGKAPLNLVKRSYFDYMQEDVANTLFKQTLNSTLLEKKIEPIATPVIECDPVIPGAPFSYTALIEIMPSIILQDYEGLNVNKENFVLDTTKVDAEIGRMRENMAILLPLEDESAILEKGNVANIDYKFSVAELPSEDEEAQGVDMETGASKIIPEFEAELIGMKIGEKKKIKITLPESYAKKEAAGKEAVFDVVLNEIKVKQLPELDDEFAQQFGEYETMEELRTKMTEYLEKQEKDRIEEEFRNNIIKALIEKNSLEVPPSMVKRQLDFMLDNMKNRLQSQNLTMEMMGFDEDGFRARFKNDAEDKVKGGLLLMALVEKESIEASEEDIENHFKEIAAENEDMLARIKSYYGANKEAMHSVIAAIKEEKAIKFLIDKAVVTVTEPATSEAAN